MSNCGQVVIPTTDETPLPCEVFTSTKCALHEEAISYLGLESNTPMDELINAFLSSLIDARNRIQILENKPPKLITSIEATAYTIVAGDEIVTFNNVAAISVTISDDAILNVPVGKEIELLNLGAGIVSISGVGITFIGNPDLNLTQGTSKTLMKIDVNTWFIK